MFKRGMLVILSLLVGCMCFVGCKKAEPVQDNQVAPAADAAQAAAPAPAADAAAPAPAAAPVADAAAPAPAAAPVADAAAPAADDAAPLPPVPPEAQAAVDKLLDVLGSIAAAGKQPTCADVLNELKKLDTDDTRKKLESTTILQKYPEDVQKAINQANQSRMIGVALEMTVYQKCQDTPESAAIDETIKSILAPIATEETAPAAPAAAAPAADAAAAPAADAPAAPAVPAADAAPAADAVPAAPAADAAPAAPAAN